MCSFLQMQLPFPSHVGIRTVMLNISGSSLAIKKGQVCVIEKKKMQWQEGPIGYPELLCDLCHAVLAILPFHTACICPPASAGAPSDAAQNSADRDKRMCYRKHWHLPLNLFFTLHSHNIYLKFANRHQRKSPFSQQSDSWSKMCSRHCRKTQKPSKL